MKQKPGPGRPKTRKFVAFVRRQYEENPSPQNMSRLLRQMEKKCPQEIAHYLAGKPVETQVQLTGEMADREFARQVARELVEQRHSPPTSAQARAEKTPPAAT
jgi:hypothetical protein